MFKNFWRLRRIVLHELHSSESRFFRTAEMYRMSISISVRDAVIPINVRLRLGVPSRIFNSDYSEYWISSGAQIRYFIRLCNLALYF